MGGGPARFGNSPEPPELEDVLLVRKPSAPGTVSPL